MTRSAASIEGMLRDFSRSLKSMTTIEVAGVALAALAAQFGMPDLMITDVTAAADHSALAVLFSARSLPNVRAFTDGKLAEHAIFSRSWKYEEPTSLSEIRNELKLSEDDLWAMMPPWVRGCEALSVNVKAGETRRYNFAYSGQDADVSAGARSVLQVASTIAVERVVEAATEGDTGSHLTKRERAILQLIAAGRSDADVSRALQIAERTVRFHIENAKRKLGVGTRAQVVLMVLRGEVE